MVPSQVFIPRRGMTRSGREVEGISFANDRRCASARGRALAHTLGEPTPRLTPRLVDALLQHDWPFNVRELFAVAQQLRISASGEELLDLDGVATRFPRAVARIRRRQARATQRPSATSATYRARSRKQVYRWITNYAIDVKQFRE